MRIAIGGIWHETNTFAPGKTEVADFMAFQFARGEQMLETYGGTGTEVGGAIAAALERDVDPVPLLFAGATPSGLVSRAAFDALLGELVERITAAGPLDAVVLCLHGAMVAEGHPTSEDDILSAVRGAVGAIPIAVTLDLHGNPTPFLAETADVLVAYDTYPHVDMQERGREALELAVRMVEGGDRPRTHLEKLPLLCVPQAQDTNEEPLRSAFHAVHELETRPDVWTASLLPGFPYSDVDHLGFAVYVAADADPQTSARDLAARIWERRHALRAELLEPAEAVEEALRDQTGDGPVVLVDVADNVGGGSPGDGTVLLAELERRGEGGAVVVLWDPLAVDRIYSETTEHMALEVGGKASPLLGDPVPLSGRVSRRGHVRYARSGSYMRGQVVDMGRVALVESGAGTVVLTERRIMPFDDDHLRQVGVRPEECRAIVAKSVISWKAAFGSYARRALYVRTPGYCPGDLRELQYSRRPRPLFPLEEDAGWA